MIARASDAIAEAGGIPAHASIVARHDRIPRIVSVHGACDAIPAGATARMVLVETGEAA